MSNTPNENDTISLKRIAAIKKELDLALSNAVDKTILYKFYEAIIKDMDARNKY